MSKFIIKKNHHGQNQKRKYNRQKSPIDHASLWSTLSQRTTRYNRMDPDNEVESDPSPERSRPNTKKGKNGEIQIVLTRDDWKRFYVERMRKLVDAPNLTNNALVDIFERQRRIYFRNKAQKEKETIVVKDEDLPPCYYWDKFQVAEWAVSVGLSDTVKDMLLSSDINGKLLITLDASTLLKMGLYDLNTIKSVTKAVREVLGLPETNGMRAVARYVPLEMFLKMKVRTGREMDMLTFKEFCEIEGIEYESARSQKLQRYKPLPDRCRVVIKPRKNEKVKWIPVERHITKTQGDQDDEESDSTSSSESDWLHSAPTVEELANNVLIRNSVIPQLMNDIVEEVFKKISENRQSNLDKKRVAEQAVKARMEQAYSDFSILQPEDKLKFATIIAEELVDDILRAREVLEDIDKFQERIQKELPKDQLQNYQTAVSHYVHNIMPAVVSAALKEMEDNSVSFQGQLDADSFSEEEKNNHIPQETSTTALFRKREDSQSNMRSR